MGIWIRVVTVGALASLGLASVPADEGRVGAFECSENGVPTFSDQPCGPDERAVEIDYAEPSASEARSAQERAGEEEVQGDLYARRIALQREIARSEGRISDLQKQRDAELAGLRSSLNDNDARATSTIWNQGVSTRMQAVTQQYSTDIANERAQLELLRQRETELGRPSELP